MGLRGYLLGIGFRQYISQQGQEGSEIVLFSIRHQLNRGPSHLHCSGEKGFEFLVVVRSALLPERSRKSGQCKSEKTVETKYENAFFTLPQDQRRCLTATKIEPYVSVLTD